MIQSTDWKPDLGNGRHVLCVVSEPICRPDLPTRIYAFAVDAAAKISFQPQQLPTRIYAKKRVANAVGGHRTDAKKGAPGEWRPSFSTGSCRPVR